MTADRASPDWIKSFMSRRELDLPPRANTLEVLHDELMDGISCSFDHEKLRKDAIRVRKRKPHMGGAIAKLHLPADPEIRFSIWGQPGHLTIWAPAERLASLVVDIVEIEV